MDLKSVGKNSIQPEISQSLIKEELFLIVKIKKSFKLSKNEVRHYPFGKRNSKNLKSCTLGDWELSEDKVDRISYIIGVDVRADHRVVSAYKIDKGKTELGFGRKKKKKYAFYSDSISDEVIKELNLFNHSFSTLKFEFGMEHLYLKKFTYLDKSIYFTG